MSDSGLPDLPGRLGQRRGEADVRRADGQVHAGRLLGALGLHPRHHGHPGRAHPVLPGLRPGEPAGQPDVRGAAGRQ